MMYNNTNEEFLPSLDIYILLNGFTFLLLFKEVTILVGRVIADEKY